MSAELLDAIRRIKAGRDGREGRDGRDGSHGINGVEGPRGAKGIDGRNGVDGKDGEKGEKGDRGDPGKDGANGDDGTHGLDGKDGRDGKDGATGGRGQRGPAGPPGPIPAHQWEGTSLRFERPDGAWGQSVDLKGDKGDPGKQAYGGGGGFSLDLLPPADSSTPEEIILKQHGMWVRATWDQFIEFIGGITPPDEAYVAAGYVADGYVTS